MSSVSVNTDDFLKLELELGRFAKRAVPFATKNTLNQGAFTVQTIAKANIDKDMIERNKFTKQSIRVDKATGTNVMTMHSVVGSTADYMADQEFGGTKTKKGKHGVVLPTSYSARQNLKSQPRKKLPTRANKLQNINMMTRHKKGTSRKQQNAINVSMAAKSKQKYIFMDTGRNKFIAKVIGGKRAPKVRMIHNLKNPSVRIPRTQWLKPAVDKMTPQVMRLIHFKSLQFQVNRMRLFRDKLI